MHHVFVRCIQCIHLISTAVTVQDMERLRQTHQEELVQQQEEQNKVQLKHRWAIDGRWPMFDAMMMPWSMSIVQYCNVLKLMFMLCSCYVHVVHAGTTELDGIGWNRAQAVELVEAEKQVVLAKSKAEIRDSETTDIKRRHGIDTLHRLVWDCWSCRVFWKYIFWQLKPAMAV